MHEYNIIYILLLFLYGICIGSFLNVCIIRLPQHRSIVRGRSACPRCSHLLHMKDMVPLLSWLLLGRKCRYCSAPVSVRYPLIEGGTGMLFVLCYLTCGLSAKMVILCLFGSALIVAAVIDAEHMIVPDGIHLFILLLALALHLSGQAPALPGCIWGSIAVASFMLLLSFVTKGGIGGGDIKLFAATSFLLGFGGNVLAFFLGYLLAAGCCVPLLLLNKLSRRTPVPMVPFFAVSLMAAALWGETFLWWYLRI